MWVVWPTSHWRWSYHNMPNMYDGNAHDMHGQSPRQDWPPPITTRWWKPNRNHGDIDNHWHWWWHLQILFAVVGQTWCVNWSQLRKHNDWKVWFCMVMVDNRSVVVACQRVCPAYFVYDSQQQMSCITTWHFFLYSILSNEWGSVLPNGVQSCSQQQNAAATCHIKTTMPT